MEKPYDPPLLQDPRNTVDALLPVFNSLILPRYPWEAQMFNFQNICTDFSLSKEKKKIVIIKNNIFYFILLINDQESKWVKQQQYIPLGEKYMQLFY